MSQIVTPEEMAALFEELREAEGGPAPRHRDVAPEIMSSGRGFPEPNRITHCQNFSDWLRALADLPWPHL